MERIKGVIVAPFTGFTPDGEVDLSKVRLQMKFYRDNGISGAFICGTTGEGSSLTVKERKALFREWTSCRECGFSLIAFLGGTSISECRELALYAQQCGIDAVAMTAPYYQKVTDTADLCECCLQVASVVPEMPFFYYHIPSLTGAYFSMYDLLRKMDSEIPNLAGIKYTYEDMMDYQLCLNFKDRKYDIMWGRDEMMLPALSVGAQSFVGSTYGYNAPIYSEIIRLFEIRDIDQAADLQFEANRIIALLGKYGGGCGKAFMKAAGLDLGPCRLPLQTLTGEQYSSFIEDLKCLQFEKYKCVFK